MRAIAIFDFFFHHLRILQSIRGITAVADWATPTTALSARIAWVSCSSLPRSVSDSVRMRAVSKVITLTARESGLEWTGNLVAAPRSQATEPQAGFHIAQSSYGTELWAAAASFD